MTKMSVLPADKFETKVPDPKRPSPILKDRFGRELSYLRMSVIDRCNLRCLYCMPASGAGFDAWPGLLTYEEMAGLGAIFAQLGIRKIRITGGEPLIRQDLEELLFRLGEIPGIEELALSTNGVFLKGRAERLKEAGLGRMNISLDTLDPERFKRIAGMDRLRDVLEGIEEALAAGLQPVKINTVLIKGMNEQDILPLVRFAVERSLEIRFIELMPTTASVQLDPFASFYSCQSARAFIEREYSLVPSDAYYSSPAQVFKIAGTEAKVGFISPLSCQFCSRCNRLRLKANGALKTCLHGPEDLNLRDLLRNGCSSEEIKRRISMTVYARPEQHYLNDTSVPHQDFQMAHVGG